jgi:hypothetical protein
MLLAYLSKDRNSIDRHGAESRNKLVSEPSVYEKGRNVTGLRCCPYESFF